MEISAKTVQQFSLPITLVLALA